MDMTENRKSVLDVFQKSICADYLTYCSRHQLSPSPDGIITFLIDKDLIPTSKIRHYTVTKEFEKTFVAHEKHKTKTVYAISDKFNIPERTIWNILKKTKN